MQNKKPSVRGVIMDIFWSCTFCQKMDANFILFYFIFFFSLFQLLAHKTVLCCFFPDIFTSDKIPSFLTDISPAVLHGLLHYFYTCSLPLDITEKTAKELLRISQLDLKSFGNVGELCTEFLEATAVKNSKFETLIKLYVLA